MGINRIIDYFKLGRQIKRDYGFPVLHQFLEIASLSYSPGRIGPGEYYVYGLYDPALPADEKRRFVGWKTENTLDALNDVQWRCLGLDKVLMYALFRDGGIRIPETKAIYLPGRKRVLYGAFSLTTETELHNWLRNPKNYPFFSKPSASGFGRGACYASHYLQSDDSVVLKNGSKIPVKSFCHDFHDKEKLGYLFQVPLVHDRRLQPMLGDTPSSLRVMVLIDEEEGPLIFRTFWKLPTGANFSDNFNSGRTGNLAAAIEESSGQIVRVITGMGLDLKEVEEHPDTKVRLKDLCIPDWQKVKDFVKSAALLLPKLRFQQWDIALTDDGPVAIEVNLFGTGGGDLTQILYRKGLLDETMQRFLARRSRMKD